MNTFIMFVIFHIHSGTAIHTQEFDDKLACAEALLVFVSHHEKRNFAGLEAAYCVPKGIMADK